jgi:hypothetical protein
LGKVGKRLPETRKPVIAWFEGILGVARRPRRKPKEKVFPLRHLRGLRATPAAARKSFFGAGKLARMAGGRKKHAKNCSTLDKSYAAKAGIKAQGGNELKRPGMNDMIENPPRRKDEGLFVEDSGPFERK